VSGLRLRRAMRRRLSGDRGSVFVELALGYIPIMVLTVVAVVAVARVVSAQMDVNAAAAAAARQASLAYTPGAAVAGAEDAADAALTGRTLTCRPRTISVNAGSMAPGGQVTVTVDCTVALQDLFGLGMPGAMTVTSEATQPLDTYRGTAMTPPTTAPVATASPALSRTARLRRLRRRLRADDRGLITPWTAIGTLMVILIAGLVFDAGMAMADQIRLYDRAQAAARAAAREIDLATYRSSGVIQLDPASAASAAERFLAQSGTTGTATATTAAVTVTVTGVRQTQLLYLIGVTTIGIDATATATAATGVTTAT